MTENGGPDAVPVGRALQIAPGYANDELRAAIATIGRIHGDGRLPTIPLLLTTGIEAQGRFILRRGEPSAIMIRHDTSHRAVAVFHEVGHFLDYSGAGGSKGYASATSPLFAAWLMSVVESATYARLSAETARGLASIPLDDLVGRRRLAVLRRPEELWARSYAQFIVRWSGRVDFTRSIAALRLGEIAGISVPLQWEDDEFDAVEREIELLMRSLGWRSTKPRSVPGRGRLRS